MYCSVCCVDFSVIFAGMYDVDVSSVHSSEHVHYIWNLSVTFSQVSLHWSLMKGWQLCFTKRIECWQSVQYKKKVWTILTEWGLTWLSLSLRCWHSWSVHRIDSNLTVESSLHGKFYLISIFKKMKSLVLENEVEEILTMVWNILRSGVSVLNQQTKGVNSTLRMSHI